MAISANRFLSLEEMKINAAEITSFLRLAGWTDNAIAGTLGNMQTESTINPGIWQNLDAWNTSLGFGLVQWTPATKYLDWASAEGLQYDALTSNLQRILYEVQQNIQWIHPTMTFSEFTQSTLPPYDLAVLFLNHYERPANPDEVQRGTQGNFWYNEITGLPYPGRGSRRRSKLRTILHRRRRY